MTHMLLFALPDTFQRLTRLVNGLIPLASVAQRLEFLEQDPLVLQFLDQEENISLFVKTLPLEIQLLVLEMIAIGQIVGDTPQEHMSAWASALLDAERFYWERGGLAGYQLLVLSRLLTEEVREEAVFHRPPGINLMAGDGQVHHSVIMGLKALPKMAEIYPVGGAADRLQFTDPMTHEALPAALLPFLGRTLLEGLVRDLQAREWLYYKIFGVQIHTPLALMTSEERGNHAVIVRLCEQSQWFGRRPSDWMFFRQPQVPMVDREGSWCVGPQGRLLQRPGGHGALWKAAQNQGVFDWLLGLGKEKILIRQINNPIAGVDLGLLAFAGVGFEKNAAFGFASCPRQVKAAEGVNVLIEKKEQGVKQYCLTNIEYCDFIKYGIEDVAEEKGGNYSLFPSNTNILFGDIFKLQAAIEQNPFPGLILNFKRLELRDDQGEVIEKDMARLESMMQNIADYFVLTVAEGEEFHSQDLPTFITYNARSKTISTAKKGFQLGSSLLETPQGSYLDYSANAYALLKHCGFRLPHFEEVDGCPFHFVYHPALGPLYDVIAQKLVGGEIAQGSELQLEIAELVVENLTLDGSLLIQAHQVMGHVDETGFLQYSDHVGKCVLKNVRIFNQGIDQEKPAVFWKNEVVRQEACEIILEGNSELIGENIILDGNFQICVPDGQRALLFMEGERLQILYEKIEKPRIHIKYSISEKETIRVEKSGG